MPRTRSPPWAPEVPGPGLAGALIKVFGAPLALVVNAVLLLGSAMVLRGIPIQ